MKEFCMVIIAWMAAMVMMKAYDIDKTLTRIAVAVESQQVEVSK